MPSGKVSIGLVQMRCEADAEANLSKAEARIRQAAARGAEIVCLQELFRSPYFCRSEDVAAFDWAEPMAGPSTRRLAALAREFEIALVVPLFERRAPGVYHNSAVLLDPRGEVAGRYRKMHIPDDPGYYEKFYFSPGDLGFRAHETPFGRVGILICWDQWFPEAARLTALKGAQILFYPTAIGWDADESPRTRGEQHSAWETSQRGHAVANGVFVAAVNRVGTEGRIVFWGQSFVADPFGRILARGSDREEETLVVECDLGRIESVRRDWPFLRDRRIDAYEGLDRRMLDETPAAEGGG